MKLHFHKYQGTGNDFIILEDAENTLQLSNKQIQFLCSQKFGIGSDGLMILRKCKDADFELTFYNPDASVSFCGNGSRCAIAFAKHIGWIANKATFKAFDGVHSAYFEKEWVWIDMEIKEEAKVFNDCTFLNTGAPHLVVNKLNIEEVDLIEEGAALRYDKRFSPIGTNVNFVMQVNANEIKIRTYEKGVENETLSCGTGVTAAALLSSKAAEITVTSKGGELKVRCNRADKFFAPVFLGGPAQLVFEGEISL
jgi:diaminopimelate epimerase